MSVKMPTIIQRKKLKEPTNLHEVLESTRTYYNTISRDYVTFYENWTKAEDIFSNVNYKKGYDKVANILTNSVTPKENIVDIGCGIGVWSTLLAQNGAYVTSLDYALNSLQKCKERARAFKVESQICTILADGFYLPFHEQTFDGATVNWVLSHIPVSKNVSFFREVSRVVKEKGWLFISDSYWRGQEGGKEQIQVRDTDCGNLDVYKYYYEPKELQDLITKVFGTIEHLETTDYELICVARKGVIEI